MEPGQARQTRRTYLKLTGVTGGLLSLSGCLSWPGGDGSDDSDSDDSNSGTDGNDESDGSSDDGGGSDTNDENNSGGGDTDQNHDGDQDSDTETDSTDENREGENEPANESTEGEEDEEEKPLTPDENETEVDKEQYDEPEHEKELKELSDSAADISLDVSLGRNGARITGTITNACGCKIQSVDVDFEFYDADGAYCGSHLVSVRGLGPGESKRIDDRVAPYDLQAVPHRAKVLAVTVMGYAS